MAKIGIVTILYNSAKVLSDFLSSLDKQDYKEFCLFAIDNKSPDNSLDILNRLKGTLTYEIVIVENHKNYGVAKANNIGIEKALAMGCDLVLLANNDIVLKRDTIRNLIDSHYKNGAMISVPKIFYYKTENINSAGGEFCYYSGNFKMNAKGRKDSHKYAISRWVDYAPTCFMLINPIVFHEIGNMDERFFVYFDDTDFCYRAYKKGFKILFEPSSIVEHKESTCTGGNMSDFFIYYFYRNLVFFARKHFDSMQKLVVYKYHILKFLFRDIYYYGYYKKIILIYRAIKEGLSIPLY